MDFSLFFVFTFKRLPILVNAPCHLFYFPVQTLFSRCFSFEVAVSLVFFEILSAASHFFLALENTVSIHFFLFVFQFQSPFMFIVFLLNSVLAIFCTGKHSNIFRLYVPVLMHCFHFSAPFVMLPFSCVVPVLPFFVNVVSIGFLSLLSAAASHILISLVDVAFIFFFLLVKTQFS